MGLADNFGDLSNGKVHGDSLWRAAQAYRRAQKPEEERKALQRLLQEAPQDPHRADAEAMLRQLPTEAQPGPGQDGKPAGRGGRAASHPARRGEAGPHQPAGDRTHSGQPPGHAARRVIRGTLLSGRQHDGERMDDQLRELVALGREHFQRGDYSLAAGHLEQAVARGLAFADVHHMLGVIYHHLGEFEAAQRAPAKGAGDQSRLCRGGAEPGHRLQRPRAVRSRPAGVRSGAGAGARQGKHEPNGDEPMDAYTRGKIANLHAAVADGYLSIRRPGDASSEYRRALTLCPTFVDLRLRLAHALREANDVEGAVAEFRIAVQHAPAYLPARVALGTALYSGGKLEEAIQQWEEVLRMDPQHRMAGMYLKMARAQAQKKARS